MDEETVGVLLPPAQVSTNGPAACFIRQGVKDDSLMGQ